MTELVYVYGLSIDNHVMVTLLGKCDNNKYKQFSTTIDSSYAYSDDTQKYKQAYSKLQFDIRDWCFTVYGRDTAIAVHLNL